MKSTADLTSSGSLQHAHQGLKILGLQIVEMLFDDRDHQVIADQGLRLDEKAFLEVAGGYSHRIENLNLDEDLFHLLRPDLSHVAISSREASRYPSPFRLPMMIPPISFSPSVILAKAQLPDQMFLQRSREG